MKIFCCPHHFETVQSSDVEVRRLISKKYVSLFLEGDGERSLGERYLFHTAKRYDSACKCEIPQGDLLERVIVAFESGWHRVDLEDFDILFVMQSRERAL